MTEIVLYIFYVSLMFLIIWKSKFFNYNNDNKHRFFLSIIFIIKIIFGFFLTIIYTKYYTDRSSADIFKFYDDSLIIYNAFFEKPLDFFNMMTGIFNQNNLSDYYNQMNNWHREFESILYNDSHIMIRYNAFLRFFSANSFHIQTLINNCLTFTGTYFLFKSFLKINNYNSKIILIIIYLIPSVLFWSSGLLKESLVFPLISIILYFSISLLIEKFKLKYLFIIVISMFFLLLLKFYVFICLFPSLISLFISYFYDNKNKVLIFIISLITIYSLGILSHFIDSIPDPLYLLHRKQVDFINLCQLKESGSLINIKQLEPNILSLLSNIPEAFSNTLFRPHIFETKSFIQFAAAIENIIILALIIIGAFFLKKWNNLNQRNKLFICFSLGFIVSLFIIIGLVTPAYGAIVRYKTPALPLLFFIISNLIFNKKYNHE